MLKKKKIIFIIALAIFAFFVFIIRNTKNTVQYVSCGSSGAVYIHDKYTEVENDKVSYFINISYSILGKKYNQTLKINDEFEIFSKELLYDSLFTDMEYGHVGFVIKMPTDVAREAGILGISTKNRETTIEIDRFFNKEDAFIEQWLEINYIQAELN